VSTALRVADTPLPERVADTPLPDADTRAGP